MKSRLVSALLLATVLMGAVDQPSYRSALPGYTFQFPRDYFGHPEFRTEWWYYTGNLRSTTGKRFGFELTFFRHAITPQLQKEANVWDMRDVWMAHLALSDLDGGQFIHTERLNRSGAGLAGVDTERGLVWNGNWRVQWMLDSQAPAGFREQKLLAVGQRFALNLSLRSGKPAVTHGAQGVSQKSAGAGRASHYVSLTRLQTRGTLTLDGKPYTVEGLSWMDHEFFTHFLEANQSGWDWFSLQFDDGSELMLYRLRRKDGSVEPYSSATYIDRTGTTQFLSLQQYSLQPGRLWRSPQSKGQYPVEWAIQVPSLGLQLRTRTPLPQQELTGTSGTSPTYWEGAITIEGTRHGQPVRGSGYLEMTGYAGAIRMGE